MAKDHVFDDVLVRAHAAAALKEFASPIKRSRYLVNTYLTLLPQYLADNPDQLPDPEDVNAPDPAKREEILTMKLPPMSEEAKARRAELDKIDKDAKVVKTEHGVAYKPPAQPAPPPRPGAPNVGGRR